MYLKALEIQGFKSFPDKTVLTFEKDITAVVGPNGSGKSNISDAISWVLGEQSSRTLRGSKMEDVIFGGTEKRSQLGFAEVSMILDNSGGIFPIENNEVMITRRYYRSGESEYYINKQSVRLKDINELFMDTGLGKEGYSIIGQGRIDEILSTKSEDRREIFEEAAGISRYRHRKEESERKLQRTEENLLRINDKISELELQVGPLKKQSETAKKYLVLRDELKSVEVSVWMENLNRLEVQRTKLESDYESAKKQLDAAHEELEELYKSAENFSSRMHEKDMEAEKLRESISEAEAKNAEYESAAAVLRANLNHNLETIETITREINDQQDRKGGISAQIAEKEKRIQDIEQEKASINEAVNETITESENLLKKSDESTFAIDSVVKEETQYTNRANELRTRISSFSSFLEELELRKINVSSDIDAANEKLEHSKKVFIETQKSYEAAKEESASLSNVINGYNLRLESRKKKADELSDKKMKLTMESNAVNSRLNMLREMEKEYEGYSKSVKTVMREKQRNTLGGIHGPVANLIKTDEKYAVAIETAMGAAMQNIIVDNEATGKAAINFLKRTDGGRATFLPLTSIKGTRLREQGVEDEFGVEGIASDLVSYDKKYENIYTYLLGRTVIVEAIDDAIRVSRKYGNRFKTVTLDGQVINAGGSMTGGSVSKNVGILSRANEIKKLEDKEKSIAEELSSVSNQYAQAKREYDAVAYEMETAQTELRRCEDTLLKMSSEKEHCEILLSAAEESVLALRDEAAGLDGRILKIKSDSAKAHEELSVTEQKISELSAEAEKLTAGKEGISKMREELFGKLAQFRADFASLEAEGNTTLAAIKELKVLRDDMAGDSLQREERINSLRSQNEFITQGISEKEDNISSVDKLIGDYKVRLAAISEEKMKIEAERTKKDRDSQDKNRDILNMERECVRLEQRKLASDMEESQIVDKLWDTYELSRSAAEKMRGEVENLQKSTKRIAELKREMNALGTPNLGAIEEYERVNSRYTYLSEQRDDITGAKDELLKIIGDITAEMKDIFAREFEIINRSFQETFLELFGGGKASLELEDKEDILNCGIDIKVQPPGKTLKTITLLSGGEKAFVAIALYFAILKVRPTPFCVMDEIEAALDESNVLRYSEYMRRMSRKTQFIVITHRRGTMEGADILYGVTMQEKGISKVIAIDLDEAQKTISK